MNTGFIDYKPSGSDYIFEPKFGGTIDWKKYLPDDEWQLGVYFDSMACVSFSACNCLEMIIREQEESGLLNTDWLRANGYYKNGKPNLSDRFIAKMSGTTRQGNTFYNVGNTIRHFGLVPEDDWNYPREQRTPVFDWNDYYKDIPQHILDKGKEFLKHYEITYTFVPNYSLKEAIKIAPVQIAVHAWNGVKDGVYQKTTRGINHAIVYVNDEIDIYDTYDPFGKRLAKDYIINDWNLYYSIKNNTMEADKFIKDNDLKFIRNIKSGAFGRILQGKLKVVNSSDRGTLMLLDNEIRKGGLNISDDLWQQLPKDNF